MNHDFQELNEKNRLFQQGPRQVSSLITGDIQGSQPRKFFASPAHKKKYDYPDHNKDFWANQWPENPEPSQNKNQSQRQQLHLLAPYSQIDAYQPQKKAHQSQQKVDPETLAPVQTEYQHQQYESSQRQEDALDHFQKEFESANHQEQTNQNQQTGGQGGYQKDYENFYRGYTPAENQQQYRFLNSLNSKKSQVGSPKPNITLDTKDIEAKQNLGQFYGLDNVITESERFRHNAKKFYAESMTPSNLNQQYSSSLLQKNKSYDFGSMGQNQPFSSPQYKPKKAENYDIVTGQFGKKAVNQNIGRRDLEKRFDPLYDSYKSPKLSDLERAEQSKRPGKDDSDFRLDRDKFFGLSDAFKDNQNPNFKNSQNNFAGRMNYYGDPSTRKSHQPNEDYIPTQQEPKTEQQQPFRPSYGAKALKNMDDLRLY